MAAPDFELVPWHVRHGDAFRALNEWWLEEWFEIEPVDARVLADPETHVLRKGGEIWFALRDGRVLGTVALKPVGGIEDPGRFELTKLAVDPAVHRGGVGRALCECVIERFAARGGDLLFLETNTVLEPAIRLYERIGFVHRPHPGGSDYARSNVYMEYGPPEG